MAKTRVCCRCKKRKKLESFSWRKDRNDYQHYCKECGKKYHREWYQKNKARIRKRMNESQTNARKLVQRRMLEYLRGHPCVDCGEEDPVVLDFDHVRGKKRRNIANMTNQPYSWETILKEIAKCDVRCANCHRRRTAKQHHWYKAV